MPVFRKLLPAERQLYGAHLRRLHRDDRYARFTGTVSEESIDRHVSGIDWTRTLLIAALDGGEVVGAVELCTDRTLWPNEAELAVSIDHGWQNRGIGGVLVRRALTAARNRGIGRVHFLCLPENRRMRSLLRRLGAEVTVDPDEVSATVALPRPDQFSLALEALEEGGGLVTGLIERMRTALPRRAA